MKFLITNDDGYDAPGLAALYRALLPLGTVTVVAPAICHSSRGHAVDTKNSIRIEQREIPPFGEITIVHASPADCVRVGLSYLAADRPDMVVAGINPGANLGVDLFYSGTAAAAREAALMGVPSMAVSRYVQPEIPIDWDRLSEWTGRVVRTLRQAPLPRLSFWNVNFPSVPDGRYPTELTFVPHGIEPHAISYERVTSDEGHHVRYSASYRDRGKSANCDVFHVFEDRLTASPVGPQMTASVDGFENPHSLIASKGEYRQVSLVDADCAD